MAQPAAARLLWDSGWMWLSCLRVGCGAGSREVDMHAPSTLDPGSLSFSLLSPSLWVEERGCIWRLGGSLLDSQWTLNLSSFYKRRDRERPKPSPARALYTAGVRSEHLASWAARAQGLLPCGFGTSWAGAHAGSAGSREAGGGKGPECAREAWEVLGFLIL